VRRRTVGFATYWTAVFVVVCSLVSGCIALVTYDRCDHLSRGEKYWRVFPPGWVCGVRIHG
jgi:hypothetical protein